MFSCGVLLHYILSVKKHPFSPADFTSKGELQIAHETEGNIMNGKMEGWDKSLPPEETHLVKWMFEKDYGKRPTAGEALDHPLFWLKDKKKDLLTAVGNQPEFKCPRVKRKRPLTAVETDLDTNVSTIVARGTWNNSGYKNMPAIYSEMTKKRKSYDTRSVVELVRFIRNAYSHVSEDKRPSPIRKWLLEDFVFLDYFPNLVMEVYKTVTTHGWDQSRDEIKYVMNK
jgi:serine/threonine protein kinase